MKNRFSQSTVKDFQLSPSYLDITPTKTFLLEAILYLSVKDSFVKYQYSSFENISESQLSDKQQQFSFKKENEKYRHFQKCEPFIHKMRVKNQFTFTQFQQHPQIHCLEARSRKFFKYLACLRMKFWSVQQFTSFI